MYLMKKVANRTKGMGLNIMKFHANIVNYFRLSEGRVILDYFFLRMEVTLLDLEDIFLLIQHEESVNYWRHL